MYGNIAGFGMQMMGSAGTIGGMFPATPSTKIPMSKTVPYTDKFGYGVG
jgi:hypothetical protein